jgi:DMSO/TMAO reductase YedYZ molybdopterin-dependent catalytic subunit
VKTDIKIARRTLLKAMLTFGASAGLVACSKSSWFDRFTGLGAPGDPGTVPDDGRLWARYAEKTDLIMLADRPPLLETPSQYLVRDITPNDAYFVRWHYAGLPTRVDLRSFRLNVTGAVAKPLQLSFNDLLTKFEPVSGVLFSACAGNSRSFFRPLVPGAQWTNGAMGNAHYRGVRLKDVLTMAGVSSKAVEASFRGIEAPPLESSPPFEKPLTIEHAMNGEVFIAYEMNGAPLPMLNGFPFRLVVPGWFATYWVKALSQISVRIEPLHNFWVDTAYRVPNSPNFSEDPSHPSENTTPVTRYPTRAVVISLDGSKKLRRDKTTIEGIVVGDGIGIRRVEVSTDGGQRWSDARLDPVIDKYSWRRWRIDWQPLQAGTYKLQCRATNDAGQTQPGYEWNHGGYARNSVDTLTVEVV